MDTSIEPYIRKFEDAKKYAKHFLQPLNESTLLTRPDADSWCIAECYSHIIEAGNRYLDQALSAMPDKNETVKTSDQPMRLRFHLRWFVRYLEPPVTFKSKSPGSFRPLDIETLNKDEILQQFLKMQDDYLEILRRADEEKLDLSGLKTGNPILPFIKMTVAECIAVTEAHQRRHMEQAEHVLQRLTDN